MLYGRENTETIVFIFVSEWNGWLFFIIFIFRGICHWGLWPRGKELFHGFEVFFFSLGTCQKSLGFGFLRKESSLGFNVFDGWLKMTLRGKPSFNLASSQFRLFIEFWPLFDFKSSLKDKLGILIVVPKAPHPNPREKEVCTKTEKRRKSFLRLSRFVMGFKKV